MPGRPISDMRTGIRQNPLSHLAFHRGGCCFIPEAQGFHLRLRIDDGGLNRYGFGYWWSSGQGCDDAYDLSYQ